MIPGQPVRIDLGCGNAKKTGFIGLDFVDGPRVDHVLDLTNDRYPFDDASVDEVFSAHFLEHIEAPNHVFSEIGRIAKDGARIEFWTPYAFSDEASLYGHLHYLTEEEWLHFTVLHRDAHVQMLGGRWLLHRINFVVLPETVDRLGGQRCGRRLRGAVLQGRRRRVRSRDRVPTKPRHTCGAPVRAWSTSRYGERQVFSPASIPPPVVSEPQTNGQAGALRRAARKLPTPVKDKIRSILR